MKTLTRQLLLLILAIFTTGALKAQVPASFELSLRNDIQVSPTVFEFDLYLLNTDPAHVFELDLYQAGILINPSIVNGGTITVTIVPGSSQLVALQQPSVISFASNCIRLPNPAIAPHGFATIVPTVSPGVRIARIQITNTVPFGQFSPNLAFNFTSVPYNTAIFAYNQTSPFLGLNITTPASCTGSGLANKVLNGPPVSLTITGLTASAKVYDGTTNATLNTTSAALAGVLSGDIVTLNSSTASGTFSDKNKGTAKNVTTSGFFLEGSSAWKYTLVQPVLTADITPAILTVTGAIANSKVYDATIAATLNAGSASLSGIIGSETVTLVATGATGTFSDKNVGSGKAVSTAGFTLGGVDAANYAVTQPSLTANITPAGMTINNVTASNKVYDATTAATLNTGSAVLSGILGTDDVNLVATSATGTFADKNAGPGKTVTTAGFTLGGADGANYLLTQPVLVADITTATLNITGVTANNKVYDGTTAATLNTGGAALSVILGSDAVTLNTSGAAGTFSDPEIGTGKTVTTSGFTINGTDALNYTLIQPTTTADIRAAIVVLTISGVSADNKVYNGNTSAALNTTSAALVGIVSPDVVTLNSSGATGTFADKNVGAAKTVTTTGFILEGADAAKYTVTQPTVAADITTASLTITGVAANDKAYDGTTSSSINTGSAALAGIIGSDNVTIISSGATASFDNKNVGTAKPVTTSGFILGGTDGGNYTVIQPSLSATITAAQLTISGVTANDKVYDTSTTATLNAGSATISGIFGTDAVDLVSAGASGAFADKNAGTGKSVLTTGFTLAGADGGNYIVTQPSPTASITPAALTINNVTANNKVYDATTAATVNSGSATLTGILGSDAVTLVSDVATAAFDDKNVGTAKMVTTAGFALAGTDGGNYTITQPSLTGDITAAALTVTGITAANKVYDATTDATLNTGSATLSGILGSDVVNISTSAVAGTFADKNAGTAKTVTVTGFGISGADAANYAMSQPTATADITPAPLTLTGVTANDKVYDATTTASLNSGAATLSGVIASDVVDLVSAGATGTFADKNVGAAKAVTTAGFTAGGTDGANYAVVQPLATASITPAGLTISGLAANNKVYDGGTDATLNAAGATLEGILGSDNVTINSSGITASFDNKNVGSGKLVAATGVVLSGTDSGNYTLTQPSLSADITAAQLTISGVTANDKVYDASTTATLNAGSATLSGIFGTDAVDLISAGASGAFADKNAGTGKSVLTTGFTLAGADGGNYIVTQPSPTASITPAALTINNVTANNKVYDATTAATVNSGSATLTGILGSDAVTLVSDVATAAFDDKNVGTAKMVTTAGFALAGTDGGNYTITQPSLTGDITAAALTVTGITAANKVYDATTDATLNTGSATLSGILGSDVVNISTSAVAGTFADKNAGTAKTVTVTGFGISGADAANYAMSQPTATADITPAPLTLTGVTANDKVYDATTTASLNSGAATLSGVIASDVVDLVSAGATGTFADKNVGAAKAVTTAGFTAGGTDGANYAVVQPLATASITPAGLTISGLAANNKVYDGGTDATLNAAGATLEGILGSDNVTINSSGVTASFDNKNVGAGKAIAATGGVLSGTDSGNYTLIQPSLSADITPASLTVLGVTAFSKVYDGSVAAGLNAANISLTGAIGLDEVSIEPSGITGVFRDKNAGLLKPVGIASYTLKGADAGNYTLAQPSWTADITAKDLTITAIDLAKSYGTEMSFIGNEFTAPGLVAGDALPGLTISSTGTPAASPVTAYPILISGVTDNNYSITYVSGTLTVNRTTLIATADNKSKIYGQDNPALTITYSGFVNGEDVSVITEPAISTTVVTGSPAGNYPISLSGGSAANYTLGLAEGTLTVNKATISVTAENKSKTYGAVNPAFTLAYSGFVGTDDVTAIDVAPGAATTALQFSIPGTYNIIPSGGTDNNYMFSYVNGSLTVTKADLMVMADNKTRSYQASNPTFTLSFTGFLNGETQTVLDQIPATQTTAVQSSNAGTYPITVTGGNDNCYNYIYHEGVLTVTKISQVITFTDVPVSLLMNAVSYLAATSTSGLSVLFESKTPEFASVAGNKLTGVAKGKARIRAYSTGDVNYLESEAFSDVDITNTHVNILHLFTPNGDGFNDTWEFPELAAWGICDVKVFNRWGKEVYANKNYDNLWDGTSNGSALPEGAYYFIIKTENAGTINGTVNIVR